tara:strand:- start:6073 stop:6459 length:387 start_codon:yes stop_codon:yes gene_type:complete
MTTTPPTCPLNPFSGLHAPREDKPSRCACGERLSAPAVPDGIRDGRTFQPSLDYVRLNAQMSRVVSALAEGAWRTLFEIARDTGDPEASISARIRDLRKPRFGKHTVDRRRREAGLFEYRLTFNQEAQ